MRRALWETLVEAIDAVRPQIGVEKGVHVTRLSLDLPIEVRVLPIGSDTELLADLPRWRWESGFDEPRGRLKVLCEEGGAE
jgi:hypothetical protein